MNRPGMPVTPEMRGDIYRIADDCDCIISRMGTTLAKVEVVPRATGSVKRFYNILFRYKFA